MPAKMEMVNQLSILSPGVLDQWEWGKREVGQFKGEMRGFLDRASVTNGGLSRRRRDGSQMPVVFIPEVKREKKPPI